MNNHTMKCALAVVGAVMFGSIPPAGATPASSMTVLKSAALASGVTEIRYRSYRGRAYYGGPGVAIGLGVLGAAAGAAALGAYGATGPGYYGPGYGAGYYEPGYGGGYYGAPSPYRRSYYYPY
jgi:hypothetical protein